MDYGEEAYDLTEDGELLNNGPYDSRPLKRSPTYVDGDTIDWLREDGAERERLRGLKSQRGFRGVIVPLVDASTMWFVIIATGIGIGIAGAWLDVLVKW